MNYFEKNAVKKWEKNFVVNGKTTKARMCIVKYESTGHYCGYAIFAKPPLKIDAVKTDSLADFVPVHGGITLIQKEGGDYIYGFDCVHEGDDEKPFTKDMDWLTEETERMVVGILFLEKYQDEYLATEVPARYKIPYFEDKEILEVYKANGVKKDTFDDYKYDPISAFIKMLEISAQKQDDNAKGG
jgi:hypothetical protein